MPRLSIGLAVFNGANYLRLSIDSILSQTYKDFELIISDNASTDATAEICREYASRDTRIRYYRQAVNIGLSRNMNFVFRQAQGEYFKWVSHDDIHLPEFLDSCVSALDANPEVVLACSQGVIIDGQGDPVRMVQHGGRTYWTDANGETLCPIRPLDPPRTLDSASTHTRYRDLLLRTGWCLEIYGVMRADVLRRTALNGDFYGADKPLLAELCLLGAFAEVPRPLLLYRQHPAQEKLYRASVRLKEMYATGKRDAQFELPRMQLLCAYRKGLQNAPLSFLEQVLCAGVLCAWCFQVQKWPGLLKEVGQLLSWPHIPVPVPISRKRQSSNACELEKLS